MKLLRPNWPAPRRIAAVHSCRFPAEFAADKLSTGIYAGLNLASHVGDDAAQVARNRELLCRHLQLPCAPLWLNQQHGNSCCNYQFSVSGTCADASVAHGSGALAVMSADCLPLLLCDVKGRSIGAVHAGWRGLAAGVIENAVAMLGARPSEVLVWFGVAIGRRHFEVGNEVRAQFCAQQDAAASAFYQAPTAGKYYADLYQLARLRLQALGIDKIYGGEYCSYQQSADFYSHRYAQAAGQPATGRMAALIWFVA